MAKVTPQPELEAIERAVRKYPDGATAQEILLALPKHAVPLRTLQHRLKYLVDQNRLVRRGQARAVKYFVPASATLEPSAADRPQHNADDAMPLSTGALAIRKYVRQPPPHANRSVMFDAS